MAINTKAPSSANYFKIQASKAMELVECKTETTKEIAAICANCTSNVEKSEAHCYGCCYSSTFAADCEER